MNPIKRYIITFIGAIWLIFNLSAAIAQLNTLPPVIRDIGVTENLSRIVPGNITFTDENGKIVTLQDYYDLEKPIILVPIYFNCPMLCSLILNGLTDGLRELLWTPGNQFTILTFSFDPNETPELANAKKKSYIRLLGNDDAGNGWHFLTGDESQISALTNAIGYRFKWSDEANEFLHASAITFLSPNGQISRYLYGIEFSELNLRNALYDAANGKIGSVIDRVMLFCYTYDPSLRSYVPHALNIMKLGGVLTMLILGTFLTVLWLRERSKKPPTNPVFIS